MILLQNRFTDTSCFYQIPPLRPHEAVSMFTTILNETGNTLASDCKNIVIPAVQKITEPLHVNILARIVCDMNSDTSLEEIRLTLGTSLEDQIDKLLEHLEKQTHGKLLQHILRYLLQAKDGLSYAELLDILSCDELLLDSVSAFAALQPIRRLPPLLLTKLIFVLKPFLHTYMVKNRTLIKLKNRSIINHIKAKQASEENSKYYSKALYEYFSGVWANGKRKQSSKKKGNNSDRYVLAQPNNFSHKELNSRKLAELPHHALKENIETMMDHYLFDDKWLLLKMQGTSVNQVIQDTMLAIESAPDNQDLQLLLEVLQLSSFALDDDPLQLYVQLSIRLNKIMSDSSDKYQRVKKLYDNCTADSLDYFEPSSMECLAQPRSVRSEDSESKSILISNIFRLKGSNRFVVCLLYERGEIRVWDMQNCTVVRTLRGLNCPRDAKFIDDFKAVILCNRELKIYNLDTGEMEVKLKGIMNQKMPYYELHDQNHIVSMSRNRMYIHIIQISTGDTVSTFKAGEDRFLNSLTVSANGHYLVCGDETQKPTPLLVWDLNNRKLIYDLRINNHEFQTKMLTVSADGHFVVCACKVIVVFTDINVSSLLNC